MRKILRTIVTKDCNGKVLNLEKEEINEENGAISSSKEVVFELCPNCHKILKHPEDEVIGVCSQCHTINICKSCSVECSLCRNLLCEKCRKGWAEGNLVVCHGCYEELNQLWNYKEKRELKKYVMDRYILLEKEKIRLKNVIRKGTSSDMDLFDYRMYMKKVQELERTQNMLIEREREGINNMLYEDILRKHDFEKIGEIYLKEIRISIYWHKEKRFVLSLTTIGGKVIIKGTKDYFMKGVSEESNELWIRDFPAFCRYMEDHFPEFGMSFLHLRDLDEPMIVKHLLEKKFIENEGLNTFDIKQKEESLKVLKEKCNYIQDQMREKREYIEMNSLSDSSINSYLKSSVGRLKSSLSETANKGMKIKREILDKKCLLKEYYEKGAATSIVFHNSTNTYMVEDEEEFERIILIIRNTIYQEHIYSLKQKLNFGQLKIPIEEACEPTIALMFKWALAGSHKQLSKYGKVFDEFCQEISDKFMVAPKDDIKLNGAVKEEKKMIGPKMCGVLFEKLDKIPKTSRFIRKLPKEGQVAWIGNIMEGDKVTDEKFYLPLNAHTFISASTGAGKSVTGRCIIEEAIMKGITVLILDAGNQGAGLMKAERRKEYLDNYKMFGLKKENARGFKLKYYGFGMNIGEKLPTNISDIYRENSIISFKGYKDNDRVTIAARILRHLLEDYTSKGESKGAQLLIGIEEAHRLLKNNCTSDAREAAEECEILIDRVGREGRKYGIFLCPIISQTIRDFSFRISTLRQNINTKIFLCNSDREIPYAGECLADGRAIIGLPTGVALIWNSQFGEVKVKIRPPYSAVEELNREQTIKLINGNGDDDVVLSDEENTVLKAAIDYVGKNNGEYINLAKLSEAVGITSRRKLMNIINDLVRKGQVETKLLNQKGQPRIIIPKSIIQDLD